MIVINDNELSIGRNGLIVSIMPAPCKVEAVYFDDYTYLHTGDKQTNRYRVVAYGLKQYRLFLYDTMRDCLDNDVVPLWFCSVTGRLVEVDSTDEMLLGFETEFEHIDWTDDMNRAAKSIDKKKEEETCQELK